MHLPRSSGVLLHPTSLPGGRLGDEARAFVDWLAEAGQSWWQVLPLGPPDDAGSPYKAQSAFACSTELLADPEARVTAEELEDFVARHPFWTGGWAAYAGPGALPGQVRFEREWDALREYARRRGVRLIGDLPIYVAEGGADHRERPELFQPGVVGGVPPDLFSRTGQLWGNPLYEWAALRATGYRWWTERFRRTFELVDVTRVDHFRGFVAYWAVRARALTARRGTWRRGPGRALFDAAQAELGELPVVAEDLGLITPPVERLRDELGLPGMRVLQFAFDGNPRNPHLPENHPEHAVAYTGTHDNDTAVGWARATGALDADEPHWALIELAFASRARVAIVPAQDVLGLGSEARLNTPGRAEGNWRWRLEPGQLTREHARRLRAIGEATGRVPARTR
ncbi:MAG: 4-alpha-glucanotransferase [Thermoleophilia bacterium]|nr:4-alpha-glucanotransferase [Thermoleophilia bacterium]